MSNTPREIGTLIVVVLKANHLPNKKHIGKQDPYCVVTVNGEKRRTKAIKRGGQHPEWDEEIRFTLYEDVSSSGPKDNNGGGTPPLPPPKETKETKGPKKIKGGRTMKLACFADDLREPDFIGETDVDLTEVLTKGETDEWFTLMNKDKFSGKVYLELTFWSNEPPPEKKATPKPAKNKDYGGPGHFTPSGEFSGTPSGLTSRAVSVGSTFDHSRQGSDTIPSSLRASSSLAKLDLYVPPYERTKSSLVDKLTNEFSEFGVSQHPRRESFPSPHGSHLSQSSSTNGYTTPTTTYQSPVYEQGEADASTYTYNNNFSHFIDHKQVYQDNYQVQYDHPAPYHPSVRGPRHSIPTTSSGFVPLPTSSGFQPPRPDAADSSAYGSPLAYNGAQYNHPSTYTPQPMAPSNAESQPGLPSSTPFVPQQSFPQVHSFQYPQYSSMTPVPQTYPNTSATPVPGQTPLVPSSTPQPYQYALATSPHDALGVSNFAANGPNFGTSSRPLPQQPQVVYTQPQSPYATQATENAQHPPSSFVPPPPVAPLYPTNVAYPQPLPPPPPPPVQYNLTQPQQPYPSNSQSSSIVLPPPPPPPIQANTSSPTSRRQSSLPQPPITYQQPLQPGYQLPPPPPPSLSESYNRTLLPPPPPPLLPLQDSTEPYHPSSLNRRVPVDVQGQWTSQAPPATQGYA